MTDTSAPYDLNHEDDRASASDGVSRYGAYLRLHVQEFAYALEERDAADFAAAAFKVASPPILTGYLRSHPRILSTTLGGQQGCLIAHIHLAGPRPDWPGIGAWRDWERDSYSDAYFAPDAYDLSERKHRYLLTRFELHETLLREEDLPACPAEGEDLAPAAHDVLAVVIPALNRVVGPILPLLEKGW
ncbi:hypothetical protein AB0395_21940 [Streptosporangium sp. NPDC051023]|uniref:hypothetical protein n=1 Tax=Streptosporangium sp. NPDC051023 TaxID=3155410 RepID=UPI003450EC43